MKLDELERLEREKAEGEERRRKAARTWHVSFERLRRRPTGLYQQPPEGVWEQELLPEIEEGGVPYTNAENLMRRLKTLLGGQVRNAQVIYRDPALQQREQTYAP